MYKHIFRIEVEVNTMQGTSLPDDAAGAFVNVFIGANDIRDAVTKVEEQLLKDCYKPVSTHTAYIIDLEETDFDENDEGYPITQDLIRIQSSEEIWYGPFHCFPLEEKKVH